MCSGTISIPIAGIPCQQHYRKDDQVEGLLTFKLYISPINRIARNKSPVFYVFLIPCVKLLLVFVKK